MYIQQVTIKNYRNFGDPPFTMPLKPFALIIGENNVGKTNLLNALALLFSQEIGIAQRRVLDVDDFNYASLSNFKKRVADQSISPEDITLPVVSIDAVLADFDPDQEAVVGDWFSDASLNTALVSYRFAPRTSFDR
jgi:putative ATP-dependent endonuclease of the OLD family